LASHGQRQTEASLQVEGYVVKLFDIVDKGIIVHDLHTLSYHFASSLRSFSSSLRNSRSPVASALRLKTERDLTISRDNASSLCRNKINGVTHPAPQVTSG
jgi:hypothetical protein